MDRDVDEQSWFFHKYGCAPGCAGPLALALVFLACLFLDSAYVTREAAQEIVGGGMPSFTEALSATSPLGDGDLLRPGPYAYLHRKAETYSWEERSGPGRDGGTTYDYVKTWTLSPEDSSQFRETEGHINSRGLKSEELWADGIALGDRPLLGEVDAEGEPLTPAPAQLQPGAKLEEQFVYRGKGSLSNPEVGDVRVTYTALRVGQQATFFGQVDPDGLRPLRTTRDGAVPPEAVLRLGTAEVAAHRAYVDLGIKAWQSQLFALLFAFLGIKAALTASLLWTQRSSSEAFRGAVLAPLGCFTLVSCLALLASADVALRLGAPSLAVAAAAVLVTLGGLLLFARWTRLARLAVERSFLWRLVLGDVSDD